MPFIFFAGKHYQLKRLNHLTDWFCAMHEKQTRHRQFGVDALIEIATHGINIMRKDNETMLDCPFQNKGVWLACQLRILDARNIDIGNSTIKAPQDFIVEVFIR